MPLHIPQTHPIYELKSTVSTACKPFLQQFGFSYFQYLRCFADGSFSALINDTRVFDYFQTFNNIPLVYSSFTAQHENAHTYWFLWDEELPKFPVNLARDEFNVHHGLTLVRRTKNYYDMIAVALPHWQMNAGSFYINKLAAIEKFIQAFDDQHHDIIQAMTKNPIALPNKSRDINYKAICLKDGRFTVRGRYGLTYVTTQELTCLRLLAFGAAYKEIARHLRVSPRTIETYINRVKQRTGYHTRAELKYVISLCQ